MITTYNEFVNENNISVPEDYSITKYEWNNGVLDCFQDVDLSNKNLTKIPFPFGKIEGYFNCSDNPNLYSLEGCPYEVTLFFDCYNCVNLTSLIGCPKKVGTEFACSQCTLLTSLEGCPEIIPENFYCDNTSLNNFDHCPKKVGNEFTGYNISSIKSIEDYPLCIIEGEIDLSLSKTHKFNKIHEIVKENVDIFENLLDDKIKFHQMVMRLDPTLISYYTTINPPSRRTIL